MGKKILSILLLVSASMACMAQQNLKMQKPKVMVVPEEAFCINAGMYKTNPDGTKAADYNAAMLNEKHP